MNYSVGELAKLTGVSIRTLHHYDEIGLLVPLERTRAGYRRYGESELQRLRQIVQYRELGFDLARIKRILDDSAGSTEEQLRRRRAELNEQVSRLERMLRRVESMIGPERESQGGAGEAGRRVQRFAWAQVVGGAVVAGAVWGVLTAVLERLVRDETLVDLPSVAILVAVTLFLAVLDRRQTTTRMFFIAAAGCWIGYMVGWATVNWRVTSDLVLGVGSIGLFTALVALGLLGGGVVLTTRSRLGTTKDSASEQNW